MIFSKNIKWDELRVETNDKGIIVKIQWTCPFCNGEVEGYKCKCKAELPSIRATKNPEHRMPGMHE